MKTIREFQVVRRAAGIIGSPNLEDAPEAAHCGVTDDDIFQRMQVHSQGDMVLEEEKGDILRSFHHQARRPTSRKALLAGFLSVWLKRCVVPSPSGDVILLIVLLPAIRLVHGRSLRLLPAMMCCIQWGLRALTAVSYTHLTLPTIYSV